MLRAMARLGAVVALAVAVLGAVFLLGMRRKSPPVVNTMRRVNRRLTNPRVLRSAGAPGASTSVVRHVGRTSGRVYETPVVPFPTSDGFAIALPYGPSADWVRNVVAAGSATLVHDGATISVDRPELVPTAEAVRQLPASDVRMLRWFHVTECLRVRVVEPATA